MSCWWIFPSPLPLTHLLWLSSSNTSCWCNRIISAKSFLISTAICEEVQLKGDCLRMPRKAWCCQSAQHCCADQANQRHDLWQNNSPAYFSVIFIQVFFSRLDICLWYLSAIIPNCMLCFSLQECSCHFRDKESRCFDCCSHLLIMLKMYDFVKVCLTQVNSNLESAPPGGLHSSRIGIYRVRVLSNQWMVYFVAIEQPMRFPVQFESVQSNCLKGVLMIMRGLKPLQLLCQWAACKTWSRLVMAKAVWVDWRCQGVSHRSKEFLTQRRESGGTGFKSSIEQLFFGLPLPGQTPQWALCISADRCCCEVS